MRLGRIYLIRNLINGKGYVGQTLQSLSGRFRKHRFDARRGSPQAIHGAIRKYGIENFRIVEIALCLEEFLNNLEIFCIQHFNTNADLGHGYNLTAGGDGKRNCKPSEETRRKMSASHKARKRAPHSAETKLSISRAHKGNVLSAEHKRKIAKSLIGNQRKKGK